MFVRAVIIWKWNAKGKERRNYNHGAHGEGKENLATEITEITEKIVKNEEEKIFGRRFTQINADNRTNRMGV